MVDPFLFLSFARGFSGRSASSFATSSSKLNSSADILSKRSTSLSSVTRRSSKVKSTGWGSALFSVSETLETLKGDESQCQYTLGFQRVKLLINGLAVVREVVQGPTPRALALLSIGLASVRSSPRSCSNAPNQATKRPHSAPSDDSHIE